MLARLAAAGHRATLVFGAHDAEHNNAVALKAFLEGRGLAGEAAAAAMRPADEVPTPRARDAKRAAPPRDDEKEPAPPAAGRRKRARRASGS